MNLSSSSGPIRLSLSMEGSSLSVHLLSPTLETLESYGEPRKIE